MATDTEELIDAIDAILPQTQCGLCEYPACRPYAEAIVNEKEKIDHCLPGGVDVLKKLGNLLAIETAPFIPALTKKAKANSKVVIREHECIGCTKCIQACPVDAIIGAAKQMHTVFADQCTGCDLCIEPCPVDCIDIVAAEPLAETAFYQRANLAKARYQKREKRLATEKKDHEKRHQQSKLSAPGSRQHTVSARQQAIQAALQRVRSKKQEQLHEQKENTGNI